MKTISKTKLKSRSLRKTNPELQETLALANKNAPWKQVAKILSGPTRSFSKINLKDIDSDSKPGDTIVIPGKILSQGNLSKKLKLCALSISASALNKLSDSKSEFSNIISEIKSNSKAEGIKLLR
jgi:large subunit ribosomal protein L18e